MNIWLLHPFAGGPGLGRHWRPYWLADAWAKMGHRPLVVSAAFHHLHREPGATGPRRIGDVDFWFVESEDLEASHVRLKFAQRILWADHVFVEFDISGTANT